MRGLLTSAGLILGVLIFAGAAGCVGDTLGVDEDYAKRDRDGGDTAETGGEDAGPIGEDGSTIVPPDAGHEAGEASAGDADAPDGSVLKRVFVTKARFNADLKTLGGGFDGLDGGDRLCNDAANVAGLGGSWKAWLSATDVDAISRIADVAPWYDAKRQNVVFATKAQLATTPSRAISMNETGTVLTGGQEAVWTGTRSGGVRDGTQCSDWTAAEATASATYGLYMSKDASWTRNVFDAKDVCNVAHALYCFEQ
jgi:hypothetical protein